MTSINAKKNSNGKPINANGNRPGGPKQERPLGLMNSILCKINRNSILHNVILLVTK